MASAPTVIEADLAREEHQRDIVALTAAYALDPMGNNGPLPPDVLRRLIPCLREHPTTMVLLAYLDGNAVGIATCFLGLSTFKAQTLINIHDFAVLPGFRGQGVAQALLQAVERKARARGCARVTLEVYEKNQRARHVYEAVGFAQAAGNAETGGALFYVKPLGSSAAAKTPS